MRELNMSGLYGFVYDDFNPNMEIVEKWQKEEPNMKIFYEENVGSIKKVLIENYDQKSISGHSENYIPVKIKGNAQDLNKIISVELLSIEDNYVVGRRQ